MPDLSYTNFEIAEGIRSRDRKIFEFLFKKYFNPLASYARFILKSQVISEEITQEVFLKLWENAASIRIDSSVRAYLYRSIHNHCLNYIKSCKTDKSQAFVTVDVNLHPDIALSHLSEDLLEKLTTTELESYLNHTIDRLPGQCREIFLLNRNEDLSYPQIASKLNISVNTVKTQIMRALEKLREAYKKF